VQTLEIDRQAESVRLDVAEHVGSGAAGLRVHATLGLEIGYFVA
jgi:hypothetical protein